MVETLDVVVKAKVVEVVFEIGSQNRTHCGVKPTRLNFVGSFMEKSQLIMSCSMMILIYNLIFLQLQLLSIQTSTSVAPASPIISILEDKYCHLLSTQSSPTTPSSMATLA